MATSNTSYSGWGGSGSGYRLRQVIDRIGVSIPNNQSEVRQRGYLETRNGHYFESITTYHEQWLDGKKVAAWSQQRSVPANGEALVFEISRVYTHNSQGKKTVAGGLILSNSFVGTLTADGSLVLDDIPRATTPTWSGNFVAGAAKTITLSRADSAFTHDVAFEFGGIVAAIGSGVGTSVSWTPPLSLLEQIPDGVTGGGTLTVVTKNGATVVGTIQKPFTLEAGAGIVPTVSAVTWSDHNPVIAANIGAFVQSHSLVKGTVTAAGAYGSTITEKRLKIGATQIPENQPVTIAGSGTITASGEVTDSRGRIGVKSANFTVLPWLPPVTTVFDVVRTNASGTPQDDGKYLKLTLAATISSLLVASVQKNSMTITVRTRAIGAPAWNARNTITAELSYNNSVLITGGGIFADTTSYEVEVTITDKTTFKSVLVTTVGTAKPALHLKGTNVGVAKMHERGALDVGGDMFSTGDVNADENVVAGGEVFAGSTLLAPIGAGMLWYTDTAPTGWLFCRGQAISRTTYAALFALMGTTYGAGNGSSTFNLPNLAGRTPVGKSSDTEFDSLGKTFGTKTHTLTVAESAPHSHPTAGGGTTAFIRTGQGNAPYVGGSAGFSSNPRTGNEGGGEPHNNIQPSLTVNHIIRAL